jgi:RNA polymerase sigma-70 factor (ECF subfamily)
MWFQCLTSPLNSPIVVEINSCSRVSSGFLLAHPLAYVTETSDPHNSQINVATMSAELFTREALPQLDALRNFAFKLCRDEQYTNDLVQETMLKACRSFHTYRPGTNCRAWLFQICKNSYINDYRRKQYETITLDFVEENVGNSDDVQRSSQVFLTDNSSAGAHEAMVGDEVAEALDALPADYQTALILSDMEGYTYEEIAEFSCTPIGTIRSRIHRGRKMLAERLEKYAYTHGYGPSLFSCVQ